MVVHDLVLQPDKYTLPTYRISPFRTADISTNRNAPPSTDIDDYLRDRFKGKQYVFCENGRHAINVALASLGVPTRGAVTIFTTTGNFYISSCVTNEIEKYGRWSRELSDDTQALLVNHEFGFAYESLRQLRELRLPIIEDAAHSFMSDNAEHSVGDVGEFTVYSFPKFFPVQFGGLLVFDEGVRIAEPLASDSKRYLQKVLSLHLRGLEETKRARIANYQYLSERFDAIGFAPRFELNDRSVPGVFMFSTGGGVDLPALKVFLWAHGIECSVFYGEDAFFLPVNERLTPDDMDYFFEAVRQFTQR